MVGVELGLICVELCVFVVDLFCVVCEFLCLFVLLLLCVEGIDYGGDFVEVFGVCCEVGDFMFLFVCEGFVVVGVVDDCVGVFCCVWKFFGELVGYCV